MFAPNEHPTQCENYLSRALGSPVKLVRATQLTQSTRLAPWRLDVSINGIERAYVLQLDARGIEYEYQILKALEAITLPTPCAYGIDLKGEALGTACFLSDFIAGESLLNPMLAGEPWAETVYLDAVCALQTVTRADLGEMAHKMNQETASEVLENAYAYLKDHPHPLASAMYQKLKASQPDFPPLRFSNGDLWLDNFIVQDKKLAGIIDFQNAAFSDPIFEFLLSFFVSPELQGRGIEKRYCQRIGADPTILRWYRGLEFLNAWCWTSMTGKNFVHHTRESLAANIKNYLEQQKDIQVIRP